MGVIIFGRALHTIKQQQKSMDLVFVTGIESRVEVSELQQNVQSHLQFLDDFCPECG